MAKFKIYLPSILVFLFDRLSKNVAFFAVNRQGDIEIARFLKITWVKNPGAAFGILPSFSSIFMVLGAIAGIFLIVYLWKQSQSLSFIEKLGFSCILGAVAGNLWDRIFYRKVLDFIDIKIWPVFNLADVFLITGVILVMYANLIIKKDQVKKAPAQP